MMNDEMNIHDEFEDWLKQSADKHRMFPSDKLWRNINEELHEQHNWPALTFGAILTMALITATLVFLHPTKNVFTIPDYAYNTTPVTAVKKISTTGIPEAVSVKTPAFIKQKEPAYAFNSSSISNLELLPTQSDVDLASEMIPSSESISQIESPNVGEVQVIAPRATINSQSSLNNTIKATEGMVAKESSISANTEVKEENNQAKEEELLSQHTSATTIHLPQATKKRWHVEVYGGSNISYRRLSETMFDDHATASRPTSSDRSNLNNVVSQKPSVGINAGVAFVYALSDRLRIKAGVQVNFRQYNIDAYKSGYERSVLLLNNGFYFPDSVYTYSAISNEQGKAISLTNKYYQIGIPVGLEWTAVKLPNLHFNLAANVQPTYQINSNNYLLTSDYKNYVQAPGLLRRININAGVEATANFNAGNLQWQVGPQVLYQTLPTQKANYSIHEHLIDYGVRVGIIKRL